MAHIHSLTVVCPIFPRSLSFCFDQPGFALSAIGVAPFDQQRISAIDRNLPLRDFLKRMAAIFDSFSYVSPGVKIYAETEFGAHLAWESDAASRISESRTDRLAARFHLN